MITDNIERLAMQLSRTIAIDADYDDILDYLDNLDDLDLDVLDEDGGYDDRGD